MPVLPPDSILASHRLILFKLKTYYACSNHNGDYQEQCFGSSPLWSPTPSNETRKQYPCNECNVDMMWKHVAQDHRGQRQQKSFDVRFKRWWYVFQHKFLRPSASWSTVASNRLIGHPLDIGRRFAHATLIRCCIKAAPHSHPHKLLN